MPAVRALAEPHERDDVPRLGRVRVGGLCCVASRSEAVSVGEASPLRPAAVAVADEKWRSWSVGESGEVVPPVDEAREVIGAEPVAKRTLLGIELVSSPVPPRPLVSSESGPAISPSRGLAVAEGVKAPERS